MSRPVPAREAFGYGYGLFRLERGGRDYVGHGGGMVGYQAGLQWDPEVGIGAVVLQSCYGGNPLALARQAVRQVVACATVGIRRARARWSTGRTTTRRNPRRRRRRRLRTQAPFVGTWRSHQPWTPAFRVEARGDDLWLAFPAAPDGFDDEAPLVPMARGWYRVGDGSARTGADALRHGRRRAGAARLAVGLGLLPGGPAALIMDLELLVRGFVLGFTIAAAVGPISVLCIRRTLAEGRTVGLVSGLGVATADATYGAIAAFGLTAITDLLVEWRQPLAIVGGLFLLWIAWTTFRSVPGEAAMTVEGDRRGLPGAYLSTLGLTLTNPMTILSFAALFVGLGVTAGDALGAAVLTGGVFLGSAAWWVVLTTVVGALRTRITPTWLRRVNIVSGLVIGAFALVAIWTGLAIA